MNEDIQTYGIEALAAATMAAPPHRLALLAVVCLASSGSVTLTGGIVSVSSALADWIEERDRKMPGMTSQNRLPGDDEVDLDLTTQTRDGVRSFGKP